jgi:hypothetical protein
MCRSSVLTDFFKYRANNYLAPVLSVFPSYFRTKSRCPPSRVPRKQRTGQVALNMAVLSNSGLLIYLWNHIWLVYVRHRWQNPQIVIVTPSSRGDVLALNLHKQCSVSQYFWSRNTFSLVSIYVAHVFCGPSFIE